MLTGDWECIPTSCTCPAAEKETEVHLGHYGLCKWRGTSVLHGNWPLHHPACPHTPSHRQLTTLIQDDMVMTGERPGCSTQAGRGGARPVFGNQQLGEWQGAHAALSLCPALLPCPRFHLLYSSLTTSLLSLQSSDTEKQLSRSGSEVEVKKFTASDREIKQKSVDLMSQ